MCCKTFNLNCYGCSKRIVGRYHKEDVILYTWYLRLLKSREHSIPVLESTPVSFRVFGHFIFKFLYIYFMYFIQTRTLPVEDSEESLFVAADKVTRFNYNTQFQTPVGRTASTDTSLVRTSENVIWRRHLATAQFQFLRENNLFSIFTLHFSFLSFFPFLHLSFLTSVVCLPIAFIFPSWHNSFQLP
jgi:hypothetical protein